MGLPAEARDLMGGCLWGFEAVCFWGVLGVFWGIPHRIHGTGSFLSNLP